MTIIIGKRNELDPSRERCRTSLSGKKFFERKKSDDYRCIIETSIFFSRYDNNNWKEKSIRPFWSDFALPFGDKKKSISKRWITNENRNSNFGSLVEQQLRKESNGPHGSSFALPLGG